jgi:chromosomal replication initiation ATPase DnaA
MIHAAETVPTAKRQFRPLARRKDAPAETLQSMFGMDVYDNPSGWKGPPVRGQLIAMMQAAWHFLEDFRDGKQPRWLSLLGSSGSGKTHLAKTVWKIYRHDRNLFRASVENGEIVYPGEWCDWPRLAGDLQSNSGYSELEELASAKLIIVDEIGADRDKHGHVRDCLARLLSTRVGKWTLITSNMSLTAIRDKMDSRIASRMLRDGSVVVDVEVPDFNTIKTT